MAKTERNYKDTLFRMVFREKQELLSLYNALNGTAYDNPNMPLRNLFYLSRLLERTIADQSLYAAAIVRIPTPRFFVFYNGREEQPEKTLLKLSDAFRKSVDKPELELTVTMLNINAGFNQELQERCKSLKDYISYVEKVRKYANEHGIEQAVNRTVNECIEEDILRKFLVRYKTEVIS